MEISMYREIEKKTIKNFNLRCIDGSVHGCGRCVGYCSYDGHAGFLTPELQKEHSCLQKECYYHCPKPAASSKPRRGNNVLQEEILSASQTATAAMEGLRVIRVTMERDATCTVYYAAIAKYDISSVENEISASTTHPIRMKQIQCSFDTAAALVMT